MSQDTISKQEVFEEGIIQPMASFQVLVLTGGICLFVYCALNILGFSSKGPRKDSYASNLQSSYGNVKGGSSFAHLQSSGQNFTPILKITFVIGLGLIIWIRQIVF